MCLDGVIKWIGLAANVGVLVGLVLVGLQLTQTTDAIRMQHRSELQVGVHEAEMAAMGEDVGPSFVAALEDPKSLRPDQLFRVWGYVNAGLYTASSTWVAYQAGQVTLEDWEFARGAAVGYVDFEVGRVIWKHTKAGYPAGFVAEVDAALEVSRQAPTIPLQWRAVLRDIRALEGAPLEGAPPTRHQADAQR